MSSSYLLRGGSVSSGDPEKARQFWQGLNTAASQKNHKEEEDDFDDWVFGWGAKPFFEPESEERKIEEENHHMDLTQNNRMNLAQYAWAPGIIAGAIYATHKLKQEAEERLTALALNISKNPILGSGDVEDIFKQRIADSTNRIGEGNVARRLKRKKKRFSSLYGRSGKGFKIGNGDTCKKLRWGRDKLSATGESLGLEGEEEELVLEES